MPRLEGKEPSTPVHITLLLAIAVSTALGLEYFGVTQHSVNCRLFRFSGISSSSQVILKPN